MVAAGVAFALALLGPQDAEIKQAIKRFQAEFHRAGAKPDEKIAAVRALAKHPDEAVLRTLAPALHRESLPVRIVIVRELTAFAGVPGTGAALLNALRNRANGGNKYAPVRIMLLRGLGELRCAEAAADVNRLIEDRTVWIAKAAIDAAGQLKQRSSVPFLIGALKRMEGPAGEGLPSFGILEELEELIPSRDVVRAATSVPKTERDVLLQPLRSALLSITGKTFATGREYEAWWKAGGRRE